MAMLQKGTSKLTRSAKEVKRYRVLKKLIPAIMGAIGVLVALVYVVALMYTRFGSFSVSVNKYHQLQYGLSLCENKDFLKSSSRLNCRASEYITNIAGEELDKYDLGAVDGVDSGEDYLCYTFYCKNTGGKEMSFEYSILITNMTMNIEKAVRVRLITNLNGENAQKVDYARARGVDENNNAVPEPNTVAFYDKNTVVKNVVDGFQVDDVMKCTIVIWLEGTDPDCIDDIIGGEFKVDMKFTVKEVGGEAVSDD